MQLRIGETTDWVTVVALFAPGNVFIGFDADETPLFVGQQRYAYVPLGRSHVGHASLFVNEPTPRALEGALSPLVQRPVIRAPAGSVATIDIDIRPGN
jgi:hypothetical protein